MFSFLSKYLVFVLFGYALISFHPKSYFKFKNKELSYTLFFALLRGLILYLASGFIIYLASFFLSHHLIGSDFFGILFLKNASIPESILSVMFFLVVICYVSFSKLFRGNKRILGRKSFSEHQRLFGKYVYDNSNQFDKFLLENSEKNHSVNNEEQHLIITLNNRKVYIGYISELKPDKFLDEKYIKIIPLQSGYRDSETLEFKMTNDYQGMLKKELDKLKQLSNPQDINSIQETISEFLMPIIIDKKEIITLAVWRKQLNARASCL